MPERPSKITRLRLNTFTRLEVLRTHPRETVDDLINHALDKLDKIKRPHDNQGRFTKQP